MKLAIVLLSALIAGACGRSSETAPPANQAPAPAPASAASAGGLNITLTTTPDPPKSGDNAIEVTVTDAQGAPVTDATVQAEFIMPPMPSMNMPAMRSNATLAHQGGGRYTGTGQLSMAGTWTTTVTVAREGQAPVTKRLSVNAN